MYMYPGGGREGGRKGWREAGGREAGGEGGSEGREGGERLSTQLIITVRALYMSAARKENRDAMYVDLFIFLRLTFDF